MNKPCIEYPCRWIYKLFGTSEMELRRVVDEVMAGRKHHVEISKRSSGGKYVSLHLETDVASEDERNKIYSALNNNKAVIRLL